MKNTVFATASDWLSAFSAGHPVSIIPSKIAAELLGDTPSSISKRLGSGDIGFVTINERRYVSADALSCQLKENVALMRAIRLDLEKIAAAGQTIFYGDLMGKFGMRWQSPPDRKKIGSLLGNISKQTYREQGILLSALVHRKSARPTNPGPGYFALLKEMAETIKGFHYNEKDEDLLQKHMKAVWKFYSPKA